MHSDIVTGLFVGRAERRWPGRPASAIGKRPVAADEAPLILETEGFLLDEQADPRVHGGPDKAVHHYAAGHYAAWRAEFPRLAARLVPGGFGENLSTGAGGADGEPWDETSVCIGDVFELGTALVQVTQGRQPCWKLNAHLGEPRMAARFQETGRTGWYHRVLRPGRVAIGDVMRLVERRHADWPLARLIAARFAPRLDPVEAAEAAALAVLAPGWRQAFARKTDPDWQEDTTRRLQG